MRLPKYWRMSNMYEAIIYIIMYIQDMISCLLQVETNKGFQTHCEGKKSNFFSWASQLWDHDLEGYLGAIRGYIIEWDGYVYTTHNHNSATQWSKDTQPTCRQQRDYNFTWIDGKIQILLITLVHNDKHCSTFYWGCSEEDMQSSIEGVYRFLLNHWYDLSFNC